MKPVFELKDVYHLKYEGAIDADGHILEPDGIWEEYIDAKYRDRALRFAKDDNGLEYLEIDGKPSQMTQAGFPATLGRMGEKEIEAFKPHPDKTYMKEAPYGSMDAQERIKLLDAEGLEAALLYPTVGILWEAELEDAELSQAYCRAYNRWIADFCRDSGGRLVPIAHISLGDPESAAAELERAVKDGCKGAFVVTFSITRKAHGHPDHDPVYAKAQELGVPIAIHPSFEPVDMRSRRFENAHKFPLLSSVSASDGCRHAFTTFFDFGVFDRFPELKLVVLESGGGWVGYWLDRMDAVAEQTVIGQRGRLKEKPSFYFDRQCFVSADPDERTIPFLAKLLGSDKFFWASDYPHADHTPFYLQEVERMATELEGSDRRNLLGDNVKRVYGL